MRVADAAGDPFQMLIAAVDAVDRDGRPLGAPLAALSPVPLAHVAVAPLRHTRDRSAGDAIVSAYLTKPLSPSRLLNAVVARVGRTRRTAPLPRRGVRCRRPEPGSRSTRPRRPRRPTC